ncbi:MAG: hypothetical protein H6824_01905 [Planctomycetaceae bacterium]|nr:hypothetical protein [Planctomycetaceae bacterium]
MEQLTTAESLGFKVPTTLITQDSIAAIQFFRKCGGQTVVKPLSNGYVERPDGIDSLIYTNRLTSHHLESFAQDISRCPVLLQELVPKESDVRITVVDNDIHAVVLKANDDEGMQRCDIRRNNMDDVDYSVINLPGEIQQCVRELMLRYRLRFAAIDMAIDTQQQWWFFEINPNGQWAWLDILSVTSIGGSFVKAFEDVE